MPIRKDTRSHRKKVMQPDESTPKRKAARPAAKASEPPPPREVDAPTDDTPTAQPEDREAWIRWRMRCTGDLLAKAEAKGSYTGAAQLAKQLVELRDALDEMLVARAAADEAARRATTGGKLDALIDAIRRLPPQTRLQVRAALAEESPTAN